MTTWWHYLFLANLYLVLFYAFYALLLRRETFFQLNRIYLVASAALSFVLPLVQLDWVKHLFITERVENTLYRANPMLLLQIQALPDDRLTVGEALGYAYCAGLIFMLVKLCLQFIRLRQIIRSTPRPEPYSFFKVVQVDRALPEHRLITAHEETHSCQWHSADRLLLEVLLVISWFNPVIYLYRRAVKHLHEFIADNEVVSAGTPKKHYAQLLVKQAFMAPAHRLTNTFYNNSLLKQRIIMLQKNRSKQVALVKYGLSAPLFAAMLVLSSATLNKNKFVIRISEKTSTVLDAPAADVPALIANVNPNGLKSADVSTSAETVAEKRVNDKANNTDTIPQGKNEVFSQVQQQPEFPGGNKAFYDFLGKNIRYPVEAKNAGIQGRAVLTFVVEKDGTLSGVKSLQGPGYGLEQEAIRVITASPKWLPGRQNGRLVRTQYNLPIRFTLPNPTAGTAKLPAVQNQFSPEGSKATVIGNITDTRNTFSTGESAGGNTFSTGMMPAKKDTVGSSKLWEWSDLISGTDTNKISGYRVNPAKIPLYTVDGEIVQSIKNIKAENVNTVTVVKGAEAEKKYGKKAANGVIEITLKQKP